MGYGQEIGELNMRSWLSLVIVLASCDGSELKIPCDPCNFDTEIDGGGLDWNAAINDPDLAKDWKPDTSDSYDAQMCVAGERIYVVWYQVNYRLDSAGQPVVDPTGQKSIDGFIDVYFNRSLDGGITWLAEPARIKQGPGNASGVSMDCAGDRIYVAWEDDRDGKTGYQNIYLNFSTDAGDSWQPDDIPLDNDSEGVAISLGPKVAMYEGQVHVVWYDQMEGAPDIYMASSVNAGKNFKDPVRISGGQAEDEEESQAGVSWNGNPQIAIDAKGRIYVVWESTKNGKQDIFLSSSVTSGQTFSVQRRIDTGDERGSNYSFAPRLGVGVVPNDPSTDADDTSVAYVVWHDSRSGEHRDIYMNYSDTGGEAWMDAAVRVETDAIGFSESVDPDLLVVEDQAHIVWRDARSGGYDIFYRKATAGEFDDSEAGKEIRLDTDDEGASNSIKPKLVAAAPDGSKLVAAWSDYRFDNSGQGYYNDLFYSHFPVEDSETGWAEEDLPIKALAAGSSFTEGLQLGVVGDALVAMWVDGRNGNRDVFFSRVVIGEQVDSLDILAQANQ